MMMTQTGEAVGPGTAERAKEDGAAMVEEGEGAGDADEQQGDIHLSGGRRGG